MKTMIAMAMLALLCACGKAGGGNSADSATPTRRTATLDPHPPMSAQDIDAIVKQTTANDRTQRNRARPTVPTAPMANGQEAAR